jgi:hypothetical protein
MGLGPMPILRAVLLSPPGSPVSRSRKYVSAWLSSRDTCIWEIVLAENLIRAG